MDMVAIMYRRLRKGMSPFSPDRQHIHHLIMRAGFTSRQAFCPDYAGCCDPGFYRRVG